MIALPRYGMGTAAIGNLYRPITDAAAAQAVAAALAGGIRYFDTAPHYGFGLAEQRLGAALAGAPADVIVSTKVGRVLEPIAEPLRERHGFVDARPFEPRFDYSADGVRRSFEDSLGRLRRDRVELLLAHDLGAETHGADHARHLRDFLDGGYRAMADLKAEGAIDAIGIGVNEVAICLDLLERVPLDVILIAGRYTLLDRQAADRLLPECTRRGVTVIVGGPYNSGILARDDLGPAESLHFDYAQAPADVVARARAMATACAAHGVPLPASALQFPLRDARVSTVVAGLADAGEVADLLGRADRPLPAALWDELRDIA